MGRPRVQCPQDPSSTMPVRRTFTDTRPSARANAQDRAGDVSLPDLAHRTPLSSQQESEVDRPVPHPPGAAHHAPGVRGQLGAGDAPASRPTLAGNAFGRRWHHPRSHRVRRARRGSIIARSCETPTCREASAFCGLSSAQISGAAEAHRPRQRARQAPSSPPDRMHSAAAGPCCDRKGADLCPGQVTSADLRRPFGVLDTQLWRLGAHPRQPGRTRTLLEHLR